MTVIYLPMTFSVQTSSTSSVLGDNFGCFKTATIAIVYRAYTPLEYFYKSVEGNS